MHRCSNAAGTSATGCAGGAGILAAVKYAVVTFGCRVNQADSIDVERQLRALGGRAAPPGEADLVVVNTCSVTAAADQGARQTIRRIARTNPAARIVATGCYATRAAAELAALPGVTQVVGNRGKERLADRLLLDVERTTAERFGAGDGACGDVVRPGAAGRTGYTLRVQTGCDQTCAYCIIPSTRGGGRSAPLARVAAELDAVAAAGFREVAVTGVHLGSYGRDLTPRRTLGDLLRLLDAHRSSVLFRLSSLEPMDCSPEVVDLVARSGRFAPHFHLPLQHASDRVLRAMRRPYTSAGYRRLVSGIRDRLPDAGIGSDVIVGFPGETDADAAHNAAFLQASPLTYLHVFPYSDRPGVDAVRLPGKVPGPVVRERGRAVRRVGAALAAAFRASQLGSVRSGLTTEGGAVVVTDNYLKVRVPPGTPDNRRVRVRITGAGESVTGEVVGDGGDDDGEE